MRHPGRLISRVSQGANQRRDHEIDRTACEARRLKIDSSKNDLGRQRWACLALTPLTCDCYSQKVACWYQNQLVIRPLGFLSPARAGKHPIENRSEQSASCGVLKRPHDRRHLRIKLFDETTVRETESAPSSEQLNSANGSHTASPADGQQTQISNSETTTLNTEIQETNAPETTTATATPDSAPRKLVLTGDEVYVPSALASKEWTRANWPCGLAAIAVAKPESVFTGV